MLHAACYKEGTLFLQCFYRIPCCSCLVIILRYQQVAFFGLHYIVVQVAFFMWYSACNFLLFYVVYNDVLGIVYNQEVVFGIAVANVYEPPAVIYTHWHFCRKVYTSRCLLWVFSLFNFPEVSMRIRVTSFSVDFCVPYTGSMQIPTGITSTDVTIVPQRVFLSKAEPTK